MIDHLEEPSHHLAIATDLLQDMICKLGSEFSETLYERTFYLAIKVKQDAAALRELTVAAVEADSTQECP